MASSKKVCRVCGKEYEACHSANMPAGVFRWQEVACSPECGEVYMQCVIEARAKASAHQKAKRKSPSEKRERTAVASVAMASPDPIVEPAAPAAKTIETDSDIVPEETPSWQE